jgi:GcrA cell cycle regulator
MYAAPKTGAGETGSPLSVWATPGILGRLEELYGETGSFSDIARILNDEFPGARLTRNSVIGKVHRLHWEPKRPKVPDAHRSRKRATRRAAIWELPANSQVLTAPPAPQCQELPPIPAYVAEPVPNQPKTILQLDSHCCHFPYGERPPYQYCGKPAFDGSSWCLEHCRIVWERRQ